MAEESKARSLLDLLRTIPDPRSRRGRVHPLYGMLAVLILAAMHGETSLLGMWQWAKEREARLVNEEHLGLWARPYLPGLATFWLVLQKMDAGLLERTLLQQWVLMWQGEQGYAVDGKTLRGSKRRRGEGALQMLTMAGQALRGVVDQRKVKEGDELAASLELLENVPIEGKMVSADAGILKAPFVQKVVEKKGGYIGIVKGNHPELKKALEDWLSFLRPEGHATSPDWQQVEESHGRVEERRLWMVPCEEDMQAYLERSFGWPKMQWCGWIERRRRPRWKEEWETQVHVWVAGAAFPLALSPEQVAKLLRGHWGIENGVFYVRDVSMDEDRLHGRKIAAGLSGIRNVTLTLLRKWFPEAYIPEARRKVAVMSSYGLHLLTACLLEL